MKYYRDPTVRAKWERGRAAILHDYLKQHERAADTQIMADLSISLNDLQRRVTVLRGQGVRVEREIKFGYILMKG